MIFTYLWLSDHFARFSVFASAVIVGAIFFVNIFTKGIAHSINCITFVYTKTRNDDNYHSIRPQKI